MECPVCYDNDAKCKFTCGHTFCDSCTKKWIQKGNTTCPMCRASICFKGITKQKKIMKMESLYDIYIDAISDLFEDYFDEYKHVFMFFLLVVQERFKYTMKKFPNITTEQMDVVLRYTWISIGDLVEDSTYIIYEPQTYRKFLFVGRNEYAVRESK